MTDPIYSIIERLALIESRSNLNPQQKSAGQLPALFKPANVSPVLASKTDPANPFKGKMAGSLEETMQNVEEDMLSKVKKSFVDYLEKLEKEDHLDSHLVKKAKHDLEIGDDAEVDEQDVEEAEWDHDVAPVAGPSDPEDSEVAHGLEDQIGTAVSQPTAPLGESPIKTYAMEDGSCLECYGDEHQGFELRHGGRSLPTRFPRMDHADMAVKLFQKRRQAPQHTNQDYIEER